LMDRLMPNWKVHRQALNRLPVRHENWQYRASTGDLPLLAKPRRPGDKSNRRLRRERPRELC
jgi:hypothetical protein